MTHCLRPRTLWFGAPGLVVLAVAATASAQTAPATSSLAGSGWEIEGCGRRLSAVLSQRSMR